MPLSITPYEARFEGPWDDLVARSHGGTVMHSRRFLGYHGDRFQDESLCAWSDPGVRLAAILPLARSPGAGDVVVSHPGSTFGGLIEDGIDPQDRAAILSGFAQILLDRGFRQMVYKPAPAIFGEQFDESDLRLMMRMGSVRRSDLWNFIRLDHDHGLSPKRRASFRAAGRKGVTVRRAADEADWRRFHAMLCDNLESRHGKAPVHSLDEMLALRERLAGENELWLAVGPDGDIVAGTWCLFYTAHTIHTQYIASTAEGRKLGAVDFLLASLVEDAAARGLRGFSFGINTEGDGFSINSGLLKQKLGFGSGVTVHWQFDVDLARLARGEAGFL